MLRVHLVIRDLVHADGTEGTKPDVKRHIPDLDPFLPDFSQKLFGKMQPGSGGGGGADLAGIDRLVAFLVLKLLLNIRPVPPKRRPLSRPKAKIPPLLPFPL